MLKLKIGQGYDVHRLIDGKDLIIGGVLIPFNKGLLGHSDADVLIHSIIDSILGALKLGDIGKIFPDNDLKYKNIDSRHLLQEVHQKYLKNTWIINNIDCTIIAQSPKLIDYVDLMCENIARDLNIEVDKINIKAKTNESLGYLGENKAIEAQSIILLIRNFN